MNKVEKIPVGYKQTKIGVIPEDWDCLKITDTTMPLANSIKIGPFGSALKKEYLTNKGFKVYGQENVYKRDMSIGDRFISSNHFRELKSCEVVPGDFLISMMGTVGQCMIVPEGINTGIMDSHLLRIKFDNLKIDLCFVVQLFKTKIVFNQIKQLSVGGIMEGLSSKIIKSIYIPLPQAKNEQTAIATVLFDTDALIEHLEKLIAKNKTIKQGAMQQLLTGKKRLPGFSGEWRVKKLGEITKFYKGKGLPKSEITTNGKYKCIHYGELFTTYHEEIKKIFSYTNKKDNFFLSHANDVLMPTSDVTPNGLATASCVKENEVILGGDVLVIRSFEGVLDGVFLSYGIRQNRKQIMQLVSGSTVYHLYGSDMKKYKFSIPPSIEEQTAIATVLSDMDSEIEKLEQKLDKYKQIKTGMMQQLLTGKIRLGKNLL